MDWFGIGRRLTPNERNLIEKYFPQSFDNSVIRIRKMSKRRSERLERLGSTRSRGYAFRNTIWINEKYWSKYTDEIAVTNPEAAELLIHEVFHVFQYSKGMTSRRQRRFERKHGLPVLRGGVEYLWTFRETGEDQLREFKQQGVEAQASMFAAGARHAETVEDIIDIWKAVLEYLKGL
ncbi:MAG: hypothetical protein HC927_06270 [Deltaproteobacteria bacterium]|nr:hypothetical protein [Deltaproteobacteria bacterium]